MNKQEQIRQYLDQTFEQIAEKYPDFVTADRKQRASEMFVNREADFDTVRQEIDKAVVKAISDYEEQLAHHKKNEYLKTARQSLDYSKPFEIQRMDKQGNVIKENLEIQFIEIKEGSANPPHVISYNGVIGYYKNSINTTSPDFDLFEYVICQLGKKLDIKMAETYRLYQDGIDMGIISESVIGETDKQYTISEVKSLVYDGILPINIEQLNQVRDKYAYLNNNQYQTEFVDKQGKIHSQIVLENMEDISSAITYFPDMISCFDIPQEQKDAIIQDYYDTIMLDLITGNQDRNPNNYGLIQKADGTIEFAPLYDNSAIDIPHFSKELTGKELTQINGFMMDRNDMLNCLYEQHYEHISPITMELLEHQEEYNQFLTETCDRELDKKEEDWLLHGKLLPNIDRICNKEREFQKNQSLEQQEDEMIVVYEVRKQLEEEHQQIDTYNTFVEVSPEQIAQTQALGNIDNPNVFGGEGNSASPISNGGRGAR